MSTHEGRGVSHLRPSADDRSAYVATAPCGCSYALAVETPSDEMIADTKHGAVIDRMTVAEAREKWVVNCPHNPQWGGMP